MPHIKINQPNKTYIGTTIEIDGKKIQGVRNIDYYVGVDGQTGISLDFVGTTDIDLNADYIKLDISPNNVREAIIVLRDVLQKDKEIYNAFVDSIISAIDDHTKWMDLPIMDKPLLAEKILDRIIGED